MFSSKNHESTSNVKGVNLRETSDLKAHPLGKFLALMLADKGWAVRRVETVRFLDRERLERRISLDVDTLAIRRMLRESGLNDLTHAPIVIAMLPKGLLLDLDVRLNDESVSVVPSDIDSLYSVAWLIEVMAGNHFCPTGEDIENLYKHARLFPDTHSTPMPTVPSKAPLQQLIKNFMMFVQIPLESSPTITLKMRLVESILGMGQHRSPIEAVGLRGIELLVEAPFVGLATREHLRIIAPPGLFIARAELMATKVTATDRWVKRNSGSTAIHYTTGLEPGNYFSILQLRPRTSGSLIASTISAALVFITSLCGIIGEFASNALTRSASGWIDVSATATFTIAIPTIAIAFAIRVDDHALTVRMLKWPRVILVLSGAAFLLACLSLALHGWYLTILATWSASCVISLVATLICIWLLGNSYYLQDLIRLNTDRTEELPIGSLAISSESAI